MASKQINFKFITLDSTVHVWRIPLSPAKAMAEYRSILVPEERERADQFRFEIHRERWTICRSVVRSLLGLYLPDSEQALEIKYGDNGKPYLEYFPDLHFNISHSKNMALLAVTRSGPLGIDIESVDRNIDHLVLSKRFFAPVEQQILKEVGEEERNDTFFKIWSRKEAYIKCSGQGLRIPLSSFAINTSTEKPLILLHNKEVSNERWRLHHLHVNDNFRAACITSVPEQKIIVMSDDITRY